MKGGEFFSKRLQLHSGGRKPQCWQQIIECHNGPRSQGRPSHFLSMWPSQATLSPLCLSEACCQSVFKQQELTEKQMLYVGRTVLDNYIPPSHCHVQNSGVQKFLPALSVFELLYCWVTIACLSHWAVYFGPSWKEKYKILGYLYWSVPGRGTDQYRYTRGRGEEWQATTSDVQELQLHFSTTELNSYWNPYSLKERERAVQGLSSFSLWCHLAISLFLWLATRHWDSHCVWVTISVCWHLLRRCDSCHVWQVVIVELSLVP